jgi:sugar lactone lactonase YvrE
MMTSTAAGPAGSASKNVTTLAGQAGTMGFTDAPALLAYPAGMTVIGANLFICDSFNSTIREYSGGTVTTIAGVAGAAGYFDNQGTGLTYSYFNHPEGIATDGTNLYVADSGNNVIRKIATPGVGTSQVSTVAGNLNGYAGSADNPTGTSAFFNNPLGIAFSGGSLYVTDSGNSTIRQVSTTTTAVTTIAGQAGVLGNANGTGTTAAFTYPEGIVAGGAGILYVTDTWNGTVREVTTGGTVTTLAGQAGISGDVDGTGASSVFNWPEGIATDGTNLYVADTLNNVIRQVVLGSGTVTTLAGQGGVTGSADGAGNIATFNHPMRVLWTASTLFVTDTYNETLRKVTPVP